MSRIASPHERILVRSPCKGKASRVRASRSPRRRSSSFDEVECVRSTLERRCNRDVRSEVGLARRLLVTSISLIGSSLDTPRTSAARRASPQSSGAARAIVSFPVKATLMESAFVFASCRLVAMTLHANFEVHRRARRRRGLGLEHVVGRFQFQIELVEHTGHRQCHLHFGQALAQAGVRAAAVR